MFIDEQIPKLYPTNDFIFKRIYGRKGCEEITESLIKSYTGLEVKIDEIQEILTDKMEIYIIMLEKIKKEIELGEIGEKSKKALWTKFLIAPETLKEEDMKENKDLEKANEIYEETLQDEEEWRQALRREMFLCDIVSAREEGLEKGYEQGLELGKEEGKKKGIQEGIQEGLKEGQREEKNRIAKKMLLKNVLFRI